MTRWARRRWRVRVACWRHGYCPLCLSARDPRCPVCGGAPGGRYVSRTLRGLWAERYGAQPHVDGLDTLSTRQ